MPNENFYIPGVPENLQGILYTPQQSAGRTKQLRQQHAGDPAMQERLMADDRYWQGKGMMEASPLAALATFGGSVPYDAAKLAYFNSPRPVQKVIERGTEALFPGEGFNLQTTARPTRRGTGAYLQGMAEGAYGTLRDKLEDLNTRVFDDKTIDRVRAFTARQNFGPSLSAKLMPSAETVEGWLSSEEVGPNGKYTPTPRRAVRNFATQALAAHAADPVGTSLKALSTILQTANPDFDTRPQFQAWAEDRGIMAVAPGLKPLKPMSAEAKAAQNAQLSQILSTWGEAQPVQFPINQRVRVPK